MMRDYPGLSRWHSETASAYKREMGALMSEEREREI